MQVKNPRLLCRMVTVSTLLMASVLTAAAQSGADTVPQNSCDTLTLEQAINIAVSNNRLLKNAALETDKAMHSVSITRTKGLPSLFVTAEGSQLLAPVHFSFPKGVFGNYPVIGPVPSTDTTVTSPANFSVIANATLMQPLTQLTRVRLGVRMQCAAADITREQWRSQRNEIISNVKQLYYGLSQIQSARDTVEEGIKFLTELERFVSNNVNQGTALDSDLLEVQARLARQKHELAVLDNSFASTRDKLNVVMGRAISTDFKIAAVPEASSPACTLEQLQAQALSNRPEVRQALLKTQIARDDERSKRSESRPDVSLGITYTRQQNIDVVPDQLITAGAIVTWSDPFDWGRRKLERLDKAETVRQADNGLEEAKSQILADLNAKYRDLQDALSLVEVDRLQVNAQEEKRRITMNRYKENASLLKDVLEADTALADANRQYLQDQLAASTAAAKLDQAMGEK